MNGIITHLKATVLIGKSESYDKLKININSDSKFIEFHFAS